MVFAIQIRYVDKNIINLKRFDSFFTRAIAVLIDERKITS